MRWFVQGAFQVKPKFYSQQLAHKVPKVLSDIRDLRVLRDLSALTVQMELTELTAQTELLVPPVLLALRAARDQPELQVTLAQLAQPQLWQDQRDQQV
jgi:hypothetical protein